MKKSMLSTQEVAALMNVTETSIKRWADGGRLACVKTPGGHRKFAWSDVVAFAEAGGHLLTGSLPPPGARSRAEELEFAIATKNYSKISSVFLALSLKGDREGIFDLLLYLARHHLSFTTVADEVVRPAMVRIGEQWHEGELEVSEEHRASHAIADALVRLAPELHRKRANALSVVLACPEGELHDIGLRCLASALEIEGWSVSYIGANTPAGTLTALIRERKPDLVCCSTTALRRGGKQTDDLRSIGSVCKRLGVHYVIGGGSAGGYVPKEFGCDYLSSSVADAVAHVREVFGLKPGPKRQPHPAHA